MTTIRWVCEGKLATAEEWQTRCEKDLDKARARLREAKIETAYWRQAVKEAPFKV
jgi:hypothetical protein